MVKAVVLNQQSPAPGVKLTKVIVYPAVADCVDLPDISFRKNRDEADFVLLTPVREQANFRGNATISDKIATLNNFRLKLLVAPLWPVIFDSNITLNIIGSRAALLKITQDGNNIIIEAHWNLFIPYFDRIKALPIVHREILDIFAGAVFTYAAIAMQHYRVAKNELRNIIIYNYRGNPERLLASLDIFNKPNLYHIRPTKIWQGRILAANDKYRLEIEISTATAVSFVNPEFVEEVVSFLHKVVKNYAFRYVDYLWTQHYRITFDMRSDVDMVTYDGRDIIINIERLTSRAEWKPGLYLGLGYAVMLVILQSAGTEDKKENVYLAMMKTWNRYLSLDEAIEQQCVSDLYGLTRLTKQEQCRCLSERLVGPKCTELVDDFLMLMTYSSKETFVDRLRVLNESRYGKNTGVYFEQLWNTVRNLNTSLMKDNINYSKLIEVLRNDNIDHLQLAEFLLTGRLDNRSVADVSEWQLLKTLIYDLINAPKVFRNDYKMLLKVLTKVNKSLIVYIWTLGLDNDARYEMVSAYIARLMIDIFVFNRVKIYEIVADPVECLEAEAVTGYLLNWASFTQEERRSIVGEMLSGLPRNVVAHLTVQTAADVDHLIHVMGIHTSGIFGFYLHQAYRWGSTQDQVTEKIRSYFPELLKQAQGAILPAKRVMGGPMLLLLLAQIISDVQDGFDGNTVITEEERRIVRDLISQCVDWDQKHFVIMVAGIAAGYMGSIDGWILQQFDSLLGRYDGGDRVVLRSVVQFDVENLIERTLLVAKDEEENALLNKIQRLRFGVDPVVSDQANKVLRAMACRYGVYLPEAVLKRRGIGELVMMLSRKIKAHLLCT